MTIMDNKTIPGSFRDPSGFLFSNENIIYRQVNRIYKENYDHLMDSGLYNRLSNDGFLIPHVEVDNIELGISDSNAYKIIRPERIPFISYPYEWSFSQLKHAALTTLKIQKTALDSGMSLKDSTSYNIQFSKGKPILIDTLSFEKYREGEPWIAYRQFCQHFLAPLALMSYRDIRLNQLFRIYIDGIPLDLASTLLPLRTHFKFSLLTNIHIHAKAQIKYADKNIKNNKRKLSRFAFMALIDSLESAIKNLKWEPSGTEWADYYENTNYSDGAINQKINIVGEFLDRIRPEFVWDLGANTGIFSRIANSKNIPVIAFDIDPAAVERNYLLCSENKEKNILPLVLDLTNPSPGIGWKNEERMSLIKRGPVNTIMALALIHHLAISNNTPLSRIANFFSGLCKSLIIEFVPKTDSQVQKLLMTREDIFPNYTEQDFEYEFKNYFHIAEKRKIDNSERTLYLMKTK